MNPNDDIVADAKAWLDSLPERIGTHWPNCHTDRHHAACLVRKLMEEAKRLREDSLSQKSIDQRVTALERWRDGFYDV